ncbi:MAG: hypothetical protein V1738_00365 [Patescibacteria group bacterium]
MDKSKLGTIIDANRDLAERMEKEDWQVLYDRTADLLVVCGDLPESSEYIPIDEEGFMMRMRPDEVRIYGFAIENFRRFGDRHHDFKLVFMSVTNPWRFRVMMVLFGMIGAISEMRLRSQRSEVAEYVASEAAYGSAMV